jgi:hypothetical protein
MGRLISRFVTDDADWDLLQASIGKRLYFGEVLGKHSEVYGPLEASDLTVVTDDQAFLERAQELGIKLSTGYSPLDYLDDEEEVVENSVA